MPPAPKSTLLDLWGDTAKPSIAQKSALKRPAAEDAPLVPLRKLSTAKQVCRRRRIENERWRAGVGREGHAEWTTRMVCGRLSDRRRRSEVCGFKPTCLAFDRVGGALLAVGATDGLRVFEIDADFCQIVKISGRSVSGVAWSPTDDAELAVCSRQGSQVYVYDLVDAADATARDLLASRPKRILSGGDAALAGNINVDYAESKNEELVVAISFPILGKGKIRAWANTTLRWELEIGAHPVDFLCLLENGTRSVIVAADTQRLHLWDAINYKVRDFSNEKKPHCRWSRHLSSLFPGSRGGAFDSVVKTCRDNLLVVSTIGGHQATGAPSSSSIYLVDTHCRVLSIFEMDTTLLGCAPFCTNALAGTCAVACLKNDQDCGSSLVVCRLRQATNATNVGGIGTVAQDAT